MSEKMTDEALKELDDWLKELYNGVDKKIMSNPIYREIDVQLKDKTLSDKEALLLCYGERYAYTLLAKKLRKDGGFS